MNTVLNPVFVDVQTLRRITMRPVLGVVSKTWLERGEVVRRVDMSSFAIAGGTLVAVFVLSFLFKDSASLLLQKVMFQLSS